MSDTPKNDLKTKEVLDTILFSDAFHREVLARDTIDAAEARERALDSLGAKLRDEAAAEKAWRDGKLTSGLGSSKAIFGPRAWSSRSDSSTTACLERGLKELDDRSERVSSHELERLKRSDEDSWMRFFEEYRGLFERVSRSQLRKRHPEIPAAERKARAEQLASEALSSFYLRFRAGTVHDVDKHLFRPHLIKWIRRYTDYKVHKRRAIRGQVDERELLRLEELGKDHALEHFDRMERLKRSERNRPIQSFIHHLLGRSLDPDELKPDLVGQAKRSSKSHGKPNPVRVWVAENCAQYQRAGVKARTSKGEIAAPDQVEGRPLTYRTSVRAPSQPEEACFDPGSTNATGPVRRFNMALDKLRLERPTEYALVSARFLEGRSTRELEERFGLGSATIRTRIRRTVDRLRRQLEGSEHENADSAEDAPPARDSTQMDPPRPGSARAGSTL